jgi:predicted Zn-dependent protease with MMP-like domain
MTEPSNTARFEKIVQWAHSTMPEKIRNLPDFPGIQVVDEPPVEMFERMSKRSNWLPGTELLGCYSGVSRTKRQHSLVQTSPELIFVFRGPILRCSKGNLPAEVKQVVWHEVAHWLGHDEGEVKELGLSLSFRDIPRDPIESEAATGVARRRALDSELVPLSPFETDSHAVFPGGYPKLERGNTPSLMEVLMQRSSVSPQSGFFLRPWARMGMAALMFLCGFLAVRKGLLQFDWVPWLCFGIFYLYGVRRQKGEHWGAYFKRPRAIVSSALLAAAVVGFFHSFYVLFTK